MGLVAVDKGVYVLNNKHRLTQKKAISLFYLYFPNYFKGDSFQNLGVTPDTDCLPLLEKHMCVTELLWLAVLWCATARTIFLFRV